MSFEVDRCRLLRAAGPALASSVLPRPYRLSYGEHATGHHPVIYVVDPDNGGNPNQVQRREIIWQGSEWYSPIYEGRDEGQSPGVQPDFAVATQDIDAFFTALAAAVVQRDADRDATAQAEATRAAADKQARVARIKQAIAEARQPQPPQG